MFIARITALSLVGLVMILVVTVEANAQILVGSDRAESAGNRPSGDDAHTRHANIANGCLWAAQNQGSSGQRLLKTSGFAFIDQAFNSELSYLNQIFPVRPAVFLQNERVQNAFATPDHLDPSMPDGAVVFDLALVNAELSQSGAYNNFSMPVIMAHEYSHIYQYKYGRQLPTKLMELQADYLAGWYMAHRDPPGSGWSPTAFQQSMAALFNKGDYAFNSATHHGTPTERLQAVTAGISDFSLTLPQVYIKSLNFVSSMGVNVGTAGSRSLEDLNVATRNSPKGLDERAEGGQRSSAGLCDDINTYVGDVNSGFKSLKGPADKYGHGEAFSVKQGISGFKECLIWVPNDGDRPYATCDFVNGEPGFADEANAIKACLPPPQWTAKMNTRTSRRFNKTLTELTVENANVRMKLQGMVTGRVQLTIEPSVR